MPALRPVVFLRENEAATRSELRLQGVLQIIERERPVISLSFARSQRQQSFDRLPRGATVVIPAQLYNAFDLLRLRLRAGRLVLDLDDAIWTRPNDLRLRGAKDISITRLFRSFLALECADLVTCASPYLASKLARLCDRPIRLVPSPLPDHPGPGHETESELLWLGSQSTRPYLEAILPFLARLGALRLLVLSDDPTPLAPVGSLQISSHPWSLEAQCSALRADTIGLMPSGMDSWSLGKCGFKLLQYMAAARPVVSVAQSAGSFLLPTGYRHFATAEPDSWSRAIKPLLESLERRRQIGAALLTQARRRFAVDLIGARWCQLLRDLDD